MRFLSIFLLSLMMSCNAQSQSIEVVYAETRDLTKKAQGIDNAEVMAILGNLSKEETLYTLQYSGGKSLYSKTKNSGSDQGANVTVIDISGDGFKFYKDQKTKKTIEQNSVLNKIFLMEEDLVSLNWEVQEGTEEVAGYKVAKATCKNAEGEITTAWYTEDVAVNDGPLHYWGLPGLILKVSVGDKTIEAKRIEMGNEVVTIDVPNDGEMVSRADYEKIKTKRRDNFMSGFGGAGNVITIDKNK